MFKAIHRWLQKNFPEDTMTIERYKELCGNPELRLTQEEIDQGYRFCCEWDGLLIHPRHLESFCCRCLKEDGFKVCRSRHDARD